MIDNNIIAFLYTEYKGETLYYRKDHISNWVPFDYNIITPYPSIEDALAAAEKIEFFNDSLDIGIKYLHINESDLKTLNGGKVTLVETEKIIRVPEHGLLGTSDHPQINKVQYSHPILTGKPE